MTDQAGRNAWTFLTWLMDALAKRGEVIHKARRFPPPELPLVPQKVHFGETHENSDGPAQIRQMSELGPC